MPQRRSAGTQSSATHGPRRPRRRGPSIPSPIPPLLRPSPAAMAFLPSRLTMRGAAARTLHGWSDDLPRHDAAVEPAAVFGMPYRSRSRVLRPCAAGVGPGVCQVGWNRGPASLRVAPVWSDAMTWGLDLSSYVGRAGGSAERSRRCSETGPARSATSRRRSRGRKTGGGSDIGAGRTLRRNSLAHTGNARKQPVPIRSPATAHARPQRQA